MHENWDHKLNKKIDVVVLIQTGTIFGTWLKCRLGNARIIGNMISKGNIQEVDASGTC